MLDSFLPLRHRWPVVLTGLAFWTAVATASEHVAPKAPAAAASQAAGTAGEPGAAAAAPKPAQDPMDRLRERLAQKLGATKPPGADNPNLLRIVSKSGVAAHADPADIVTSPGAAHAVLARHGRRAPAAASAAPSAPHSGVEPGQAHWDYSGSGGPESWGQLKPEFNKCASGKRQSPIDIQDGIRVDLDPVSVDYKPGAFKVVDNGHTVQVNVAAGNSIEVTGRRYDLIQFHFHRPSEERINGKQYDMVVHLVHRDLEGRLAVIAVLLDRGSALQAVQTVWNNLPLEKGDEVLARALLNPADLLPADRSYYTYMGSLTTPPCSEGVLWMVMKRPMPVSAEQLGIFARLYPMNARPVQASAGRLIKESN